MSELLFTVEGQAIAVKSAVVKVSDTINYFTAKFYFSSDWNDTDAKYAHFQYKGEQYDKELDSNDEIKLGLDLEAGTYIVWLHGAKYDGETLTKRITTNKCSFSVQKSGMLEGGEPFPSMRESIGERYVREAKEASEKAINASEQSISASNSASESAKQASSAATSAIQNAEEVRTNTSSVADMKRNVERMVNDFESTSEQAKTELSTVGQNAKKEVISTSNQAKEELRTIGEQTKNSVSDIASDFLGAGNQLKIEITDLRDQASTSAQNASKSKEAAKSSETNAKLSETNAKTAESNVSHMKEDIGTVHDDILVLSKKASEAVVVSNSKPTGEWTWLWIKPNSSDTYTFPEVDDNSVSNEDTWSSQKIKHELDEIHAVAEGKTKTFVFDDKTQMTVWIGSHRSELKTGDVLLLRSTSEPDYWWDGSDAQILETVKVDLTDYALKTEIPKNLSDLNSDSGHRTVSDLEKESWDGKSEFSGDYNDLKNKPAIPDAVTESTISGWGFTKNTGTYSKPTGGIPESDLDEEVKRKLVEESELIAVKESLDRLDVSTNSLKTDSDALWNLNDGKTYERTERLETGMNDEVPEKAKYESILEVHGNSEQKQYQGYNMFNSYALQKRTLNGVTASVQEDGSVLIEGTPTIDTGYIITVGTETTTVDKERFIVGHIYRRWCNLTGGGLCIIKKDGSRTYANEVIFSDEIDEIRPYIQARAESYVPNMLFKTLLYDATLYQELPPYEPFVGNRTSPSPEFPQEIKSVDKINVKVIGKNLLDGKTGGYLQNGKNVGIPSDTTLGFYLSDFIPFIKDVVIKCKYYDSSLEKAYGYRYCLYNDKKESILSICITLIKDVGIVLREKYPTAKYIRVSSPIEFGDFQIEYGTEATEYEPYNGTERTIIPPKPLNKVGDYADVLDVANGEFVYRNVIEKIGKMNEIVYQPNDGRFVMKGINIPSSQTRTIQVLSEKYISKHNKEQFDRNWDGVSYIISDSIYIHDHRYADVDTFKAQEMNTEIIHQSTGKEVIPISTSDFAWIKENILMTSAGRHIFVTDQNGDDISYLMQYILDAEEYAKKSDLEQHYATKESLQQLDSRLSESIAEISNSGNIVNNFKINWIQGQLVVDTSAKTKSYLQSEKMCYSEHIDISSIPIGENIYFKIPEGVDVFIRYFDTNTSTYSSIKGVGWYTDGEYTVQKESVNNRYAIMSVKASNGLNLEPKDVNIFMFTKSKMGIWDDITNDYYCIYPEQFGTKGNGTDDDTVALQNAINEIQGTNKILKFRNGAVYCVSRVNITDFANIDGNNATIKALSTISPIKVERKNNRPSGFIKNLVIDMNNIATGGLYIVEDWRRNYENISFYNIAQNTSGQSVALNYVKGGGCFFDKIRGYQEKGNFFDAIFINCSGNDSTFSHCDYERYKYGMQVAGENLVDNFHGFIDENEMYEGSYFMRVSGGVICNQVYPDTQQYGFICRSTTGLIVNGMKFYFNNVMINYDNIPKGYVFYCDLNGQEKVNRFKATKLCGAYMIKTENMEHNINYAFCNSDNGDEDNGGIDIVNAVFHGLPPVHA